MLAEKIVDELGIYTILEREPGYIPLGQRLSWLDGVNLNPLRVYSMRDKALEVFEKNLRVSSGAKTSVIALSYKLMDPKLSQKVLESLLRLANGEHLRIHKTRGSQEFFVSQSKLLDGNLVRLEGQLRDLKNQTKVSSLEIQRELQLKLIGTLTGDLIRLAPNSKRFKRRSNAVAPTERRAGSARRRANDRSAPVLGPGAPREALRPGDPRAGIGRAVCSGTSAAR